MDEVSALIGEPTKVKKLEDDTSNAKLKWLSESSLFSSTKLHAAIAMIGAWLWWLTCNDIRLLDAFTKISFSAFNTPLPAIIPMNNNK